MRLGRGGVLAAAGVVAAGAVTSAVVARTRRDEHPAPVPPSPPPMRPGPAATPTAPAPPASPQATDEPPVTTGPPATTAPPATSAPPHATVPPTTPAPPANTAPPATTVPQRPSGPSLEHVVQPGDTLSSIARRYGTSVSAIAELNSIDDPNRIRVGQRLRIPGEEPTRAPTRPSAPAAPVRPGPPISRVPGAAGRVALTFDDGPNGAATDAILATLDRHGAKATFYVVGNLAARDGARLGRMHDAGHEVANHSWDHSQLTKLDDVAVRRQLVDTRDVIERATGRRPDTFRPPYGARSDRIDAIARELGMRTVLWDVDTVDWSRPGVDAIVASAVSDARDGSIILLHDGGGNREQTVAAVERIVTGLRARGFDFATVAELLSAAG